MLGQQALSLIDQRARIGQARRALLQRISGAERQQALLLGLFPGLVVERRRRVDFRQRGMRRSEVGMTGDNFRHLLNCGRSIAPHQAARIEVAVGHLVGVLHGEDLIFLGQLSQVTFDSVLLDRVLIAQVDPEIARDAAGGERRSGARPRSKSEGPETTTLIWSSWERISGDGPQASPCAHAGVSSSRSDAGPNQRATKNGADRGEPHRLPPRSGDKRGGHLTTNAGSSTHPASANG